jgi:hypothetical protein
MALARRVAAKIVPSFTAVLDGGAVTAFELRVA